jgi:hypothetical protein
MAQMLDHVLDLMLDIRISFWRERRRMVARPSEILQRDLLHPRRIAATLA